MEKATATPTAMRNAPMWLFVALAVFIVAWGGNQFTPLMVMYRINGDLSLVFVDFLFFVYALGIAPSLLISGPLSDRIGRKRVMLAAPVFSIIGSSFIAVGESVAGLILLGRFLSGIGVGIAMAVGGSWVKELSTRRFDHKAKPTSGAKRQSMALTAGFGIGAGIAGICAQFLPLPGQLIYFLHIAIAVPLLFGLLLVPETRQSVRLQPSDKADDKDKAAAQPKESIWESLKTPSVTRHRFIWVVAIAAPWVFGAAGVAYAIIPNLMQDQLAYPIFFSGVITVVAAGAGFLCQQVGPRLVSNDSARGTLIAMSVVLVGMGLAVWMAGHQSPLSAFVASTVLGMGYGLSMFVGLNEVQRIAGSRDLAGLTGIFYALTYIGFAFPAILTKFHQTFPWLTYPVMLAIGMVIAAITMVIVAINSKKDLPQQVEDF